MAGKWNSYLNIVYDDDSAICSAIPHARADQIAIEHNNHNPMIVMLEKSITMMCRRCPGGENCTSASDCNTVKEMKETLAAAKGQS